MIVANCRQVKRAVPRSMSAGSIASEAARRLDVAEFVEVEIDNRLQRLAGGAIAGGFGQSSEPIGVFGLQSEQFGHRGLPSLNPRAAVGGSAIADDGLVVTSVPEVPI
jgi:hypothetical protein